MKEMRITALTDGMVLASDAVDPAGKVVLSAGSIINSSSRNRLLMGRVRKVAVRKVAVRTASIPAGAEKPAVAPSPSPAAASAPGKGQGKGGAESAKSDSVVLQERLIRLAHMFEPHKEDPLMRELCRLAIKCAQERLISG